ncbi:MAG: A/G-specific adenine glycosylase [Candidatus Omnitrophica bacterium]|nr:A/G-specific adenine glycosylase [Candidatus Omnitrophota bacterium]
MVLILDFEGGIQYFHFMHSHPLFRNRLLKWYRLRARDLPWRQTKDPYKIWISEIMLQQTQVKTVIPYYKRWIARFPSLTSLARTSLQEVMKLWTGLGYYRRVRMLHETAKRLAINKRFPETASELMTLPGIGRYTAGAIASIAFRERVPVLDGNVIRVLTRFFAIKTPADSTEGQKKLWGIASTLVGANRNPFLSKDFHPGDFNQALMELGATVCLPDAPRCPACPLKSHCLGFQGRNPEKFPVKARKETIEKIRNYALILRRNGHVLIQKQSLDERWGGLWIFPFWKTRNEMMRRIKSSAGARQALLSHRMTVHHGFTKYRISLEVFELKEATAMRQTTRKMGLPLLESSRSRPSRWISTDRLKFYPLPSPHRKIAEDISKHDS